jgi:hypothetical protein
MAPWGQHVYYKHLRPWRNLRLTGCLKIEALPAALPPIRPLDNRSHTLPPPMATCLYALLSLFTRSPLPFSLPSEQKPSQMAFWHVLNFK